MPPVERAALLVEAEKFITGLANDGSIARSRKAQQWLARYRALPVETSRDAEDAARYRFLKDKLTSGGPITYYHMPHALMFLREATVGTFDTAVDARMNGAAFESSEKTG